MTRRADLGRESRPPVARRGPGVVGGPEVDPLRRRVVDRTGALRAGAPDDVAGAGPIFNAAGPAALRRPPKRAFLAQTGPRASRTRVRRCVASRPRRGARRGTARSLVARERSPRRARVGVRPPAVRAWQVGATPLADGRTIHRRLSAPWVCPLIVGIPSRRPVDDERLSRRRCPSLGRCLGPPNAARGLETATPRMIHRRADAGPLTTFPCDIGRSWPRRRP